MREGSEGGREGEREGAGEREGGRTPRWSGPYEVLINRVTYTPCHVINRVICPVSRDQPNHLPLCHVINQLSCPPCHVINRVTCPRGPLVPSFFPSKILLNLRINVV